MYGERLFAPDRAVFTKGEPGFVPGPGSVPASALCRPSRGPYYEESEGVREALVAIRKGAPVIFVSGRAGSGKSRFIKHLKDLPEGRKTLVVAPTGLAAQSLGASTIHAVFRLPIGVVDAQRLERAAFPDGLLRNVKRLIIDEISMLRADILDGVDARLRQVRGSEKPFGGVQVILVGDFLQLPPVVRPEDKRLLTRLGYSTPSAFSARVLRRNPVHMAVLQKVWRQSDPAFIAALGCIREGRDLDRAMAWLNSHCARPHRPGAAPVLLTPTRAAAEAYNAAGLDRLRTSLGLEAPVRERVLEARIEGSYARPHAVLPAPRRLTLLPGVRVMALRNDPAGAYANGSLGEVRSLRDEAGGDISVMVRFDGAVRDVRVAVAEWRCYRQAWDNLAGGIVEEVTGSFRQVPLSIAHAITIHKSQGLTLEDIRIDLGRGSFAAGQLYVALSRARTVEGLSLARPLRRDDVRVDEMLLRFLDWTRSPESLIQAV